MVDTELRRNIINSMHYHLGMIIKTMTINMNFFNVRLYSNVATSNDSEWTLSQLLDV
jgi:hypothetical protein